MTEPELPYAGTSGWSGTDTSRERAEYQDSTGGTARRQQAILDLLQHMKAPGLTVHEFPASFGHHGSISGALSVLHHAGRIALLEQRRDRCHVYCSLHHVGDRPTLPPRKNRAKSPESMEVSADDVLGGIRYLRTQVSATQMGTVIDRLLDGLTDQDPAILRDWEQAIERGRE